MSLRYLVSQIQAQKRVTYPEFNFLCKGSERNLLPFIRNENHFIDFWGRFGAPFSVPKLVRFAHASRRDCKRNRLKAA